LATRPKPACTGTDILTDRRTGKFRVIRIPAALEYYIICIHKSMLSDYSYRCLWAPDVWAYARSPGVSGNCGGRESRSSRRREPSSPPPRRYLSARNLSSVPRRFADTNITILGAHSSVPAARWYDVRRAVTYNACTIHITII